MSVAMRPEHRKTVEEAASTLGDSTYEVLGDSILLTSDDEDGRTESLASTDGYTPDDVSDCFEEPTNGPVPPFPLDRTYQSTEFEAGAGSAMTAPVSSVTSSSIEFVEPEHALEAEEVEVCHTLLSFNESNMPEEYRVYNSPHISITIRQTLIRQGLSLNRPFRVLYVGDSDNWAKREVISKIASALTANRDMELASGAGESASLRYNVVPVSSFGGTLPDVELIDSSGIELVIDQCTDASFLGATHDGFATNAVQLNINEKPTIVYPDDEFPCSFPHYPQTRSGSDLADLAIFCRSPAHASLRVLNNTPSVGRIPVIRLALESLGIPILDISAANELLEHLYEPSQSDNRSCESLRMCLETHDQADSERRVLRVFPISLSTFLDIDAGQLNRHLACITRRNAKPKLHSNATATCVHQTSDDQDCYERAHWSSLRNIVTIAGPVVRWNMFPLLFVLILSLLIPHLMRSPWMQQIGRASPMDTDLILSSTIETLPGTPAARSEAKHTKASEVAAHMLGEGYTSRELSMAPTIKSLSRPFIQPVSARTNLSDKFNVQLIGDHHLVFTPPSHVSSMKNPPSLFVRVQRDSKEINTGLTKLVERVYAIDLEREYAHGILNVTIWTNSKPAISQSFDIDFGSPWLKFSTWIIAAEKLSKAFQDDVSFADLGIRTLFTHFTRSLQTSVGQIDNGTIAAAQHAHTLRRKLALRIETNTKHYVHWVAEQGAKITTDVVDAVKSFRTDISHSFNFKPVLSKSKALVKARRNALKIYSKIGMRIRRDTVPKTKGKKPCGMGRVKCLNRKE